MVLLDVNCVLKIKIREWIIHKTQDTLKIKEDNLEYKDIILKIG